MLCGTQPQIPLVQRIQLCREKPHLRAELQHGLAQVLNAGGRIGGEHHHSFGAEQAVLRATEAEHIGPRDELTEGGAEVCRCVAET